MTPVSPGEPTLPKLRLTNLNRRLIGAASVHPGAYGCTPKSRIPASGCGPRTIPDLRDHPISRTTALRSYDRRSLAPGQKGAGEPHLVNIDKHSSAIEALAVAETTAETGDQGICQTIRINNNTRHNTVATHSISITCTACRSHHQACHRETTTEIADHEVTNPPRAVTEPPAETPLLRAAKATTDETWHP